TLVQLLDDQLEPVHSRRAHPVAHAKAGTVAAPYEAGGSVVEAHRDFVGGLAEALTHLGRAHAADEWAVAGIVPQRQIDHGADHGTVAGRRAAYHARVLKSLRHGGPAPPLDLPYRKYATALVPPLPPLYPSPPRPPP